MKRKEVEGGGMNAQIPSWVRASISFPPGLYGTLAEIAKQKKVSLARVVRDATESYVADQAAKVREGERATFRATGKATRRAT
jgi:metal-responsive CopG/Arc/MetJ family transcriptional regulator